MTRTTHASVRVAAAAPSTTAPSTASAPVSQSAVKPIVDTTPRPDAVAPAPPAENRDDSAMEIGGGALALLALGAAAFALTRRRRRREEIVYDEAYEPEPVATAGTESPGEAAQEQPAIVGPESSAFAWGNPQPQTQAADGDGSDRRPGETWAERAYRGPTAANPSVSLKNRLRRAAFFDKREREVAAGEAEPVETDAGLPDSMADEQERELA